MAEWDRLESRLKDLEAAAARWVDEPLDPEDVRRLGARRRHRRWVVTVIAAAVIAVGGGVGVYAVGSLPQHQAPAPAGPPTASTSPTPTESSEEPDAYGSLIESKAAKSQRPRPIPPTHPSGWSSQPSSTPDTPTPSPTQSETPTPTPTPTPTQSETPTPIPTGGAQTSEPAPGQTEGPGPEPTSGPTGGGGEQTEPASQPSAGDHSTG